MSESAEHVERKGADERDPPQEAARAGAAAGGTAAGGAAAAAPVWFAAMDAGEVRPAPPTPASSEPPPATALFEPSTTDPPSSAGLFEPTGAGPAPVPLAPTDGPTAAPTSAAASASAPSDSSRPPPTADLSAPTAAEPAPVPFAAMDGATAATASALGPASAVSDLSRPTPDAAASAPTPAPAAPTAAPWSPPAALAFLNSPVFWLWARHLLIGGGLLLLTYAAIGNGLHLRQWAWDQTANVRSEPDLKSCFVQGRQAANGEYYGLYDRIDANHAAADPAFDYAPLRLLVITRWYEWHAKHFPQAKEWGTADKYTETAPLLTFNTACELLAALAAFLLVRLWVGRGRSESRTPDRFDFALDRTAGDNAGGAFVAALAWAWPALRWIFLAFGMAVLAANGVAMWFGATVRSGGVGCALALILLGLAVNPFRPGRRWGDYKPLLCGFAAAMLLWYNPAVIWEGHCWPQWDVWPLPFFLFAALLASMDWWLCAGIVMAAGAMFKSQFLLVAPLFALWPLFSGEPRKMLRLLIGVALGTGAVAWPWLMKEPRACPWLACSLAALVLLYPWEFYRRIEWGWRLGLGLLALPLALWPALHAASFAWVWWAAAIAAFALLLPRSLPGRRFPICAAGIAAACVLLSGLVFFEPEAMPDASPLARADGKPAQPQPAADGYAWLRVGFDYTDAVGLRAQPQMGFGRFGNLATILYRRYEKTRPTQPDLVVLPAAPTLKVGRLSLPLNIGRTGATTRSTLAAGYFIALLLCAAGAAMHARQRDPRALMAIVAPWVLLFALLPQMHERYLFWGLVLTAVAAGISLGMTLLHLLLALLAWMFMASLMVPLLKYPELSSFINGTYPGIGWMVLLIAGVMLCVTMLPRLRDPDCGPETGGPEEENGARAGAQESDAPCA